jgi:hypothetical protein
LDCQEIIIKPIVNQFHVYPSTLSINHSGEAIIVSGSIFSHKVTISYCLDNITITFHNQYFAMRFSEYHPSEKHKLIPMYDEDGVINGVHQWSYDKTSVPDNLPPEEGDKCATVIIEICIPEVANYFWNLWNDHLMPFSTVADMVSMYIRGFYIKINGWTCTEEIAKMINMYAKNKEGHTFSPIWPSRMLNDACIWWKADIYSRNYTRCVAGIPYLPGVGVHYFEAKNSFLKSNFLKRSWQEPVS